MELAGRRRHIAEARLDAERAGKRARDPDRAAGIAALVQHAQVQRRRQRRHRRMIRRRWCVRVFHGLRVMQCKGLSVTPFQPNSGVVVLPSSTALPALL